MGVVQMVVGVEMEKVVVGVEVGVVEVMLGVEVEQEAPPLHRRRCAGPPSQSGERSAAAGRCRGPARVRGEVGEGGRRRQG